jgi:hypothetical protein
MRCTASCRSLLSYQKKTAPDCLTNDNYFDKKILCLHEVRKLFRNAKHMAVPLRLLQRKTYTCLPFSKRYGHGFPPY